MLLALTALLGCVHNCTLMWAPSTLTLTFVSEDWPAGRYEIEVIGDGGRSGMCVLDLPDDGSPPACTQNARVTAADDGIPSMAVEGFTAETVQVVLSRDGEGVLDQAFTPDYTVDEPNGEGCGERYVATIDVTL